MWRSAPEAQRREQRVVDWLERKAHWPAPLRNAGAASSTPWFVRWSISLRAMACRLGMLIFVFICTYRLTDFAMGVMANPFYLDAGFTLKEIAAVVKGLRAW